MTLMPPGERLDGTTAECAHLYLLLACFRASPPPMRLPEVTGRQLTAPGPAVLGPQGAGRLYHPHTIRYSAGSSAFPRTWPPSCARSCRPAWLPAST
jgi:hypothetical protein